MDESDKTIEPNWQVPTSGVMDSVPLEWRPWLLEKGSLTLRLQDLCGNNLSLEIISQCWQIPLQSERGLLSLLDKQSAFVREVIISGSQTPWVYARSVLPETTLSGDLKKLSELGERPLGAWLFEQPSLTRGRMEVAEIKARYLLNLRQELVSDSMWGRRSMFYVQGKEMLVSEVFLPNFKIHARNFHQIPNLES